ncbi:MAG: deoxyhypusine synthase [Candidatus Bathyarchaeota archaeon]|nr:deoxyhypusine synthase [Candidatus Bathyarchaeota archaeon]MDH5494923.1 deoxyhypusine synthase [Candidatus Bathyarchaeota archaeon]
MKDVKHIQLTRGITVAQLIKEMDACGVLGAGKIGKAAKLVTRMFKNPDYTVFLTLAGALVPGGLRNIIAQLIAKGHVNVVVTTGANMVHDMVEALGYRHKVGTFRAEDKQLKRKDIGRIADIYIEHKVFKDLEKWLYRILEEIPEQKRQRISPSELLLEIGKRIDDEDSILATAARKNVPVICPGLPDSIAGFQLWIYGQDKKLVLDPLGDVSKLVGEVYEAKKSGIIILGGGLPKHFALFANTFREGVDLAVQITMDRPEPGGLSGASLEEAISWSKVKSEENTVTVISDATIAFPLIVAAALEEV